MVNGILRRGLTIDASDADIVRSACIVAAKLSLAAYYEHHKRACPTSVKINTMFVHNQHRNTQLAVANLLRKLPHDLVLKQGGWNTEGTFFLRHYSEGGERFVSIAVLHESVALMGMIGRDTETENWLPWEHGWKPSPGVGIVPVTHR